MSFDPKRSYATITGHPWAKYEQNGTLYDYQGRQPEESDGDNEQAETNVVVEEKNPHDRDFDVENAKEFLKNVLAEGQLTRGAVYRAAQNNNQKWDKVEQAFNLLGGQKIKNGVWLYWKLPTD